MGIDVGKCVAVASGVDVSAGVAAGVGAEMQDANVNAARLTTNKNCLILSLPVPLVSEAGVLHKS